MNNRYLYFSIVFTLILQSCSEFISRDITGETVVTLTPADGDTVSSYAQLFWWEEIEGAEEYHLQVVKPSFGNIQQLLLDTTIEFNKFSFSLHPGTYQWRVRALNNAGYTAYTLSTLTVDSIHDLTSQTVQLISPANNSTSTDLTQTFTWYSMPFADSYTFQVLTGNNSTIHIDPNITSDSITYTFTNYGNYKWRVWASNSTSVSYYGEYNISILPAVSAPLTPASGDTISSTSINMSWTRPAGGNIIADSLIIAKDQSFTDIVHSGLHTGTSYTFTAAQGQGYFWKLRSKVSNGAWSSSYSTIFTFYVSQ
jgi:hypothetical protein